MAFFEQLGRTINNASDSVKQKTQNLSEINSLNKMVSSNQTVVQNMYLEIGRAYYEAHKEDAADIYAGQCRMITDALNQIAQLQDQIRLKKGIQTCVNCGAQLAPGSMFCPSCGAQVRQAAGAPGTQQQPVNPAYNMPQTPVQPINNAAPQAPVQPVNNAAPQTPVQPVNNAVPQEPVQPINNAAPQTPVQPINNAVPQEPVQQAGKICGQCGSQIPADSAFCPVCGQRV